MLVWNLVCHREKRKVRVFDDRVLRKIFGCQRKGVTRRPVILA
jgi:hypothetical protein